MTYSQFINSLPENATIQLKTGEMSKEDFLRRFTAFHSDPDTTEISNCEFTIKFKQDETAETPSKGEALTDESIRN